MKKAKIILALLVVLAVCFGLAACKETAEYTLSKTNLTLEEGKTQQLTVSSSLDNEFTVEYKTSNAAVATVSESGLVTAVKAGTATITATVDGTELTCSVTVTEAAKPVVYEYALSETEITIVVGGYKDITVNVTPNKQITVNYTSANTAIATVNENGRVTAIAVGETTIKAAVDGKELTCKVTVEKAPPVYDLKAVGTPLVENGKTLIEKGATLKFEVTSSEADDEFTVVWSTSNEAIATIAQDGTVTAVANGDVTVKAKIGEVEKTIAVQVFTYQYTFEQKLTLAYGTTDAKLAVSVDHGKTLDISYVLENEDVIAIDEQGNIEIKGVGTATVTVKDGELEIGECKITVNAVLTAPKALQMHVGDEIEWTITANPVETEIDATFEVVEGDTVVSIGSKDGKVTALANGSAKVKATIGELELTCDILVNNVNAQGVTEKLEMDKNNPIDITVGAEYWEQYIGAEVNHKHYATVEEDIINKTSSINNYLSDYKAWLTWQGGANSSNCSCGLCAKDSYLTPDGGWTDGGTKAMCVNAKDAVIALNIKLYTGESVIKVYTGGYNLKGLVQLKAGDVVIAEQTFDNQSAHNSQLVTFNMDVATACDVTIELSMVDDYGDAPNSVISLAAVSVSGSVYQLEQSGTRLAPEGTAAIVMNKDGEALTEGVTYQIIEGEDYISIDKETGVVTGISLGTAKIAVTADGRTRIYTVEVGYAYSLDVDKVQLHEGQTHQINVISDPEGAQIVAQYESTDPTIATVDDDGLVEAVANGTVIIKVRVDEKEYQLTVIISDVVATSSITKLEKDKNNPIDLTDGAEYWEQYIGAEVNHKHYVTAEEDIINKTSAINNYLKDYPAFISWQGGANSSNCSCGLCNKESQNGGDGGWNGDEGTKAMAVNVKNEVIALQFKLYAGESVIKIFTGGYNLTGRVQLKLDGQVIAEETFNNKGQHNANMVTFTVDTINACEVTAELVMIDDNNNAPHSCISLAAASISGSVYQLAKASERVAPNGTTQITINKDGVALAEGVTYEVVTEEGATALATVSATGLVTAGETIGTATIKVTANGRVRYFTLEIGYDYEIDSTSASLKPNGTHQINITSIPAGSTATATYTSGDENVATVSASGLITAVASGSTTISAEVDGKQFTIDVVVSDLTATVDYKNIAGQVIDLTSSDVIYWEHYIWNETNKATTEKAGKDLIDIDISGNSGSAGYPAHMFWADGDENNPKAMSAYDEAFHKFSTSSLFTAQVTVPAGTHEIRVYSGGWEAITTKISLNYNDTEICSCTLPGTGSNQGTAYVAVFTVEVDEEATVNIKLEGSGNSRLAAIAVANPITTRQDAPSLTVSSKYMNGEQINLTEKGNLDWLAFNIENVPDGEGTGNLVSKVDGEYITRQALSGNYWDYNGKFTWGADGTAVATECHDGDTSWTGEGYHNNFMGEDSIFTEQIKVDSSVKTITLYLTGWKTSYALFVTDSNGNNLLVQSVCDRDGQNSRAVEVTITVDATVAETLMFTVRKTNGDGKDAHGNIGIAAIAVGGEVATPEVTD